MRTPEQRKARIKRRAAKRAWNKANPKIRDYRLYTLELENGKYYVGMTAYKDAKIRFNQHLEGTGAKWTKLHKPIRIIEVIELGNSTEARVAQAETELTIQYMEKYGISNVRGGSLCFVSDNMTKLHYNRYARVKIIVPATNTKRIRQEAKIQEQLADELGWI